MMGRNIACSSFPKEEPINSRSKKTPETDCGPEVILNDQLPAWIEPLVLPPSLGISIQLESPEINRPLRREQAIDLGNDVAEQAIGVSDAPYAS
jgi:hypothetical protein